MTVEQMLSVQAESWLLFYLYLIVLSDNEILLPVMLPESCRGEKTTVLDRNCMGFFALEKTEVGFYGSTVTSSPGDG